MLSPRLIFSAFYTFQFAINNELVSELKSRYLSSLINFLSRTLDKDCD